MLRIRPTIIALACLAGACAIFAATLLHEGLLEGGKMLADWMATRWTSQQIEAFMQYALPVSLAVIALSLLFSFAPTLSAQKQ